MKSYHNQISNVCFRGQLHSNQKIQYLCLQDSCQLNRLLCKTCVHESHRKHKVGIIDKLIEPLNRLNMNSCYQTSPDDYVYLNERLKAICDEWEKLNDIFYNNMKQLQNGILFQLNTVMKTFTNEEIDKAYDMLQNKNAEIDSINEYVAMVNFLNKDYLEDVEAVKKFANVISERVKKVISKTVKKVDNLLKKMQEHIKEVDFTKYHQFKNYVDHDQSDKDEKVNEKQDELKKQAEEDSNTQKKGIKQDIRENLSKKKGRQKEFDNEDTKFSSIGHLQSSSSSRQGFQKYK